MEGRGAEYRYQICEEKCAGNSDRHMIGEPNRREHMLRDHQKTLWGPGRDDPIAAESLNWEEPYLLDCRRKNQEGWSQIEKERGGERSRRGGGI